MSDITRFMHIETQEIFLVDNESYNYVSVKEHNCVHAVGPMLLYDSCCCSYIHCTLIKFQDCYNKKFTDTERLRGFCCYIWKAL